MKVCYIAHYAVSLAGGELSLIGLIENEIKKGIEPILIVDYECPLSRKVNELGVTTIIFPIKSYFYSKHSVTIKSYIKYPVKRIYNYSRHERMKQILRAEKIDLIHFNSSVVCFEWAAVANQMHIPYVWHLREFMDLDHNSVIIGEKYLYSLMRRSKALIAISNAIRIHWKQKLGVDCALVYNGLNMDAYYLENKILDKETVKCVIIARVVEGKGQMDAVKAIHELVQNGIDNVELSIVGYRNKSRYEKDIREYVINNKLEKYISLIDYTDDVTAIHKVSDIGLVCSKAEAFGRITIEYMLAGLLTIGANSGGTPELIEDGETGYLYETGNYRELARNIKKVIENRDLSRKIALNGQVHARDNFSIERTADKVYAIYQQVLK